jgi:subtilase family serine protease
MMRRSRHALFAALLWIAVPALVLGQGAAAPAAGARVPTRLDDGDRVVLRGNVPPRARPELEVGRTDAELPMQRMILQLEPRPGAKAQIEKLLLDQQDPASPLYHRWLTPEEFGARFGLADADLQLVTGWLGAHGFTVEEVAKGRGWINFSGVASQVEQAFATEMHDYRVDGTTRHANSIDPSIPRGLAGLVGGVVSLHSFPRPARHGSIHPASGPRPRFNEGGGTHDLAPADFATIYDLNSAYGFGNDGSGQSIAIVARTDILRSDVRTFRRTFGLPANDPVFVHNGPDPGIVSGEEPESDLDTQWAGAVAPGATIKLVISASTNSSDGVLLSAQYIVDHNLAPVATTSYGLCEALQGASEIAFYDNLLSQGAAQGITSFAVAGDAGAADCSDPNGATGSGRAVDNPCSSPNNTCVGGTQFDDTANPSAYWAATNDPVTLGSALSYIPEVAWNESGNSTGGSGLWSTGGGASSFFSKPSWQVAPGVPADGRRDVPDVSLSAAAHDGYLVYMGGASFSFSGTSAAAPSFAGLMALVVQRTGSRQGNANPAFYKLAAAQYAGSGPAVFHDVKSGNNSVPGVTGSSCGTGYDQVTGLGSVDGAVLLETWPGSIPPDTSPCAASASTLCLNNNRFEVKATFDAGGGNSGTAQTVALTDDTGYLWFFAAANVEAVVKVLNGCALGAHYWVFAGGLTNVNVVMKVRDTQTGAVRTYANPSNTAYLPLQDTAAFSTCP